MALQFLNDGVFSGDVAGTILIAQKASIPSGNGAFIGRLSFKAYNVGTTYSAGASITAVASSAWTSTSTGTHLQFSTTSDTSVNPVNKMYLTSGGDLGVGVQVPGSRISIAGFTGSYTSGIGFEPYGTGARIYRTFIGTDGSFNLDDATAAETRLTIDTSGNATFGNDISLGGNLTLTTNARYLRAEDNAGTTTRLLGINGSNSTYIGPIDAYAGGSVYYGVSANVSSHTLYTGASARLHINSSGNVGIGTTTPSQKLEVSGNIKLSTIADKIMFGAGGTSPAWSAPQIARIGTTMTMSDYSGVQFGGYDGTSYGPRMTVLGAGNVGIGTTSPASLLEISQQLSAASTIDYPYTISSRDDGNLINQAGGEGVGIKFRIAGNDGTTPGNSLVGASIAAIRETASDTNSSTGLGFFVTQNDETLDEALRIDHDRNIQFNAYGAGTLITDASGNITVSSGGGAGGPYLPLSAGSSYPLTGELYVNSNTYSQTYRSSRTDGEIYIQAATASDFVSIGTQVANSLMRIQGNGNVGIGTTSPSGTLEVSKGGEGQYFKGGGDNASNGRGLEFSTSSYKGSNGAQHTINATSGNGAISLNTANVSRVFLDNTGNVGIGTDSPDAKLHVASGTSETSTYTVDINHVRNDANVATHAMRLNVDLSGADTTTADRTNSGLWLDLDSSANGDASNEHRIRGVNSDVKFSGFSDAVNSGYFLAESNYTGGKTAQLIGVLGNATHDTSSTDGGVSNMYGVYGVSSIQDLGDVDNAFGGYFSVDIASSRGNANVGVTKGVEGHIDINKAETISYGEMMAVSGIIDNNETTFPTFGNQYLFKGDYQGLKGNNAYGIYCEGDKHYFDGSVGIGTTSPGAKLTVKGADSLNAFKITDSGDGDGFKVTSHTTQGTYAQIYNAAHTQTIMLDGRSDSTARHTYFNGGGNVGIGTTNPVETLTVPGGKGAMLGYKKFYSNTGFVPAGVGSAYALVPILNDEQGTSLTSKYQYKFYLTTVGTGTYNSSVYIVYRNSADDAWVARELSRSGTSSNHPELTVSSTSAQIYNDHPSSYAVAYRVETSYSAQAKTSPNIFGSDYMWQRTDTRLTYLDGNVGIGTTSPGYKLHVNGGGLQTTTLTGNKISYYDGNGIGAYSSTGWNIGNYVGDLSLTNNADDKDIIFKTSAGTAAAVEIMRIDGSSGNVGIGTTSPNGKLDVAGDIRLQSDNQIYFGGTGSIPYWNVGVENTTNNNFEIAGVSYYSGDRDILLTPVNNGNVGIKNTAPSYTLDVTGNGRYTSTVTATNFILSSDERLKDNIKEIKTNHIDVSWKNFELKSEPGIKRAGVIAQELEEKHPEFVRTDDEGMKSVAYIDLLIAKIAELEARLEKAGI